MNIVGKNVRKIREKNDWTQEQLAARCNLLEWNISRGTLAKIEAKVRRVTDVEVKLLAEALETNIEALF
ncbi:helix-turn-helix domain-containing protein [Psychromonas sp. PT13]|uniref:helix-turn-helix domain-containing protein n=1 Tax=Psychromonas sp. PT13 TaxID=3439547 RepID=UPI003EB75ACB